MFGNKKKSLDDKSSEYGQSVINSPFYWKKDQQLCVLSGSWRCCGEECFDDAGLFCAIH